MPSEQVGREPWLNATEDDDVTQLLDDCRRLERQRRLEDEVDTSG